MLVWIERVRGADMSSVGGSGMTSKGIAGTSSLGEAVAGDPGSWGFEGLEATNLGVSGSTRFPGIEESLVVGSAGSA